MDDERKPSSNDIDLHLTASKNELSMKAKGTGVLVLLVLCISGIVAIAYFMSVKDSNPMLVLPLMFLIYITYELIATLDAMLGISRRRTPGD